MRGAIALLALVFGATLAAAQDFPAYYDVTGVAGNDVLNIRTAPDAGSAISGVFGPQDQDIEVVATSGNWAQVNLGEQSGWVAMRYMQRQDNPSWHSGQVALQCGGVEPFWSFTYAPETRALRYDTPEGYRFLQFDAVQGGANYADAVLVLSSGEGAAVIDANACSDGMSEQAAALRVRHFLEQGELRSGCCHLTR